MSERFAELARSYGNAAQIVSALVAVAALVGIYWQVQTNLLSSRENSAREIYRAYLQLSVQNPELAQADIENLNSTTELARYGWLVSYLLYTCEQILVDFPRDPEWRRACLSQMSYHASYICKSVLGGEINQYEPVIRDLILEIAKTSHTAECKKAQAA